MKRTKLKYIIGIDEVGRGPLAGPVTVAAVAAKANLKFKIKNLKLRDSKKLSSKQRKRWFQWIKENQMYYATASVFPKVIDKINIAQAANLAATRVLDKLTKNSKLKTKNCSVFLDGGLKLNSKFKIQNSKLQPKSQNFGNLKIKTIIKGDEKIPAIMLASIVAKVSRDRKMRKVHKKFPQYDFFNNMGYGTKKHIAAIRKFGYSPFHRRSFKIKFFKKA